MLEKLYVKNIALIDEAEIEFDANLNVLSGETGSGKSVILDSINFVLGSKADKSMIRYGTDEALVRAEFCVDESDAAVAELSDMDVECEDGQIIISRKMTADGRGAIKINGVSVTASMLKRVCSRLVDVHGQSEHFFLLNENNQLSVIDALSGEQLTALKRRLSEALGQKKRLIEEREGLGGSEAQRAQRLDMLSYQINEIEGASVKVGESEQLKSRKKLLDNAEKVINSLGAIKQILTGDGGCTDMLSTACRQAAPISDVDETYSALYERLDNLSVEAEDIGETVSDLLDSFSFDRGEAQAVEERLSLLKNLFKKYGGDEQAVLDFLEQAKTSFDALNDAEVRLTKILALIEKLDSEIYSICREMTKIRRNCCKQFCAGVCEQLKQLNIPNAQFYVQFEPYTEEDVQVTFNGADKICFMFSANKGEPQKPLSKVISGGEMSRFMLAIKTKLKGINGISTYVFDEIDSGISGVTAISVAEKFASISKDTQIIAVSHLPQVCASATAQFLISKHEQGQKTVTSVERLTRERRIEEIVRLTGSISTEAAKVHAEELLKAFGN